MAFDVRLMSANGYYAQLSDSEVYGIQGGSALGEIEEALIFAQPWARGFHPPVGSSYGNRAARIVHHIRGTSADNWIVNYRQVAQILLDTREYWAPKDGGPPGRSGARAWLVVHPNGATNPIVYDVLAGKSHADRLFRSSMMVVSPPYLLDVPTDLILKPFGHPQTRTRNTSGTLDNGDDLYTISAPAGEVSAPVRFVLQSASGDDIKRYIVGKKLISNTDALFVLEAETTGGTGYTVTNLSGTLTYANTAVAAAHGGSVNRITWPVSTAYTNEPLFQWEITKNLHALAGTYRVFVRVDSDNNNINVKDMSLSYGGANGDDIVLASVSTPFADGISDFLVELGRMTIPHRAGPVGATLASFKFRLRGSRDSDASAGRTTDFDCIYLMPVDEQLDATLSANSSGLDQIISDGLLPQPALYLVDSSGDLQPEIVTPNRHTRFTLTPGVDNTFYTLLVNSVTNNKLGHDLTDQCTIAVESLPLFTLVR